jgi:hypothetical protein
MSSTLRRIGRLSGWKHINLTGDYTWQASGKAKEGQLQAATTFRSPETSDLISLAYDFRKS